MDPLSTRRVDQLLVAAIFALTVLLTAWAVYRRSMMLRTMRVLPSCVPIVPQVLHLVSYQVYLTCLTSERVSMVP